MAVIISRWVLVQLISARQALYLRAIWVASVDGRLRRPNGEAR